MAESVIERLLLGLTGLGAPVPPVRSRPVSDIPHAVASRLVGGGERLTWIAEIVRVAFESEVPLRVAAGWWLIPVGEIESWIEGGYEYASELEEVGGRVWEDEWLPLLGNQDGVIFADGRDRVHKLWWENGEVQDLEVSVLDFGELLISALGEEAWNEKSGILYTAGSPPDFLR